VLDDGTRHFSERRSDGGHPKCHRFQSRDATRAVRKCQCCAHVEREIAHAFYTRRTIVPLRLANTLPRRDFLFYLGSARWFNAFSPSAKQHLAALTEHIKRLIPDRTAAANGVPHRTAMGTTTRSNLSNAWPGEFRPPHYRMLGILSWVTIGACLFLIWLLCFAPNQMKEALHVANSNPGPTSSLPSAPLTPCGAERHVAQDSGTKTQQQEPEQTTTRSARKSGCRS